MKLNTPKKNYKNFSWPVIILVLSLLSVYLFTQPSAVVKVAHSALWITEVQQGQLDIIVQGFGMLASKEQRLLTAPADSTIENILLRPGEKVTPETIILHLTNPRLKQQLATTELELSRANAQYQEMQLNLKSDLLALKSTLSSLNNRYKLSLLQLQAEQTLVVNGVVSRLSVEKTMLDVEQYEQQLNFEQQRLEQISKAQQLKLKAQQEVLKQLANKRVLAQQLLASLHVKAGINGVVQKMPIALGQSVAAGEQLALIGTTDAMNANIKIAQSLADKIMLGATVKVDTRQGRINGLVNRIDPMVVDGTITIEVALLGKLPRNARPDLMVEADIFVEQLSNASYIEQPAHAREYGDSTIFKLRNDNRSAIQQSVKFGVKSGKYIVIKDGLNQGDRIIVSDMSRWQKHQEITITN